MALTKPQRIETEPDLEEDDVIMPLPRAGGGSELDEYINLGNKEATEEDVFADIPDTGPEEDDDSAPIPRIERDIKFEEEVERERFEPIEKLVADVADAGAVDRA